MCHRSLFKSMSLNYIKFSVHHLPRSDDFMPSLFREAACKSTCHFRSKRMPKFSSLRKRSSFSGANISQNMANLYSEGFPGFLWIFGPFQVKNKSCTPCTTSQEGENDPTRTRKIQIFTLTCKNHCLKHLKATDGSICWNATF